MKKQGLIPEEWIVSYAAGALSEAHATLVASHVSYHSELQQKLSDAEAIGGALLADTMPADLMDTDIDALLDKMEAHSSTESPKPISHDEDTPKPLAEYLNGDLSDIKWRGIAPGMKKADLWKGPNGEKLWMFKAAPGVKMPHHDHGGLEMTLVLKGSYHAEGTHFKKGMLEIADETVTDHNPIIDDEGECICLVVTEAPIVPKSFMVKMLQPFIGI